MKALTPPPLPVALVPVTDAADRAAIDAFVEELANRGWTAALDIAVDPASDKGPAVIRLVAPEALAACLRRPNTVAVLPLRAALWRWWGPHRLYHDLIFGVRDETVRRIVIGVQWLLVEGDRGAGIAQIRNFPELEGFDTLSQDWIGRPLQDLARLALDWQERRAALGIAAMNAFYNARAVTEPEASGLAIAAERPVVIGRFPRLDETLPQARVLERHPGPDDYPDAAADWLLADADAALATSSTLSNHSLPHLIRAASADTLSLVGPGTPLTPRLIDYGLAGLSGLLIDDIDGMAQAIADGSGAKKFRDFGRRVRLAA